MRPHVYATTSSTLTLLGLLILTTLPSQVRAQSDLDLLAAMEIGDHVGGLVSDAMDAAAGMRSAAAGATTDIQTVRNRYWDAVRKGGDVAGAREAFARKLWEKDLYYLMMAIPEGTAGTRATVVEMISGGIDGGIRPAARPQFERWVKAIRVHLGAETAFGRGQSQQEMVIPGFQALAAALESAQMQQAFYLRARDWAEIDASGVRFPWHTDARAYALMILQRYGESHTREQVLEGYRELVDMAGEVTVLSAAERVRSARRTPSGELANPAALGIVSTEPEAAFAELMAVASGRAFLNYLLWQGAGEEGSQIYHRWVWAYGGQAVEQAATAIMEQRDDIRYKYMGLGLLYRDILEVLGNADLNGFLRGVVAQGEQVDSEAQLDAALERLVSKYGDEKVRDAAARVRWAWHGGNYIGTPDLTENIRRKQERGKHVDRRTDYVELLDILENGPGPVVEDFPVAECGMGALPGDKLGTETRPEVRGMLMRRLEYPLEDAAARREGSVRVLAVVDPTGRVVHATVQKSEGASQRMEEAALEAIRASSFKPGTWNGSPVCHRWSREVPFILSSADVMAAKRELSKKPEQQAATTEQQATTERPTSTAERPRQTGSAPSTEQPVNTDPPSAGEVLTSVDEMPQLIGGLEELQKSIQYPDIARRAGIEGRVIVQIVVDTDGQVTDPQVVRGLGGGLDEEAVRLVRTASFKAGMHQGIPVRVKMSLPITFRLR